MTPPAASVMARNWKDRLARVVSVVLHPFAVFAGLALLAAAPGTVGRTAIGMAMAIVILGGFIAQRVRGGHWGTVDASERSNRPLLYALALGVTAAYWVWMGGRASPVSSGVLAAIAMIAAAGMANRWIKLSLHMASLAFAAMTLWALRQDAAVVAFALLPLLGWSRLRLRRHTWAEVVGGSALGLASGAALLALG